MLRKLVVYEDQDFLGRFLERQDIFFFEERKRVQTLDTKNVSVFFKNSKRYLCGDKHKNNPLN